MKSVRRWRASFLHRRYSLCKELDSWYEERTSPIPKEFLGFLTGLGGGARGYGRGEGGSVRDMMTGENEVD